MLLYLVISSVLIANGMAGYICHHPTRYYEPEHKCIYMERRGTFDQARENCKGSGGDLIKITSVEKDELLDGAVFAYNMGEMVWIGVHFDDVTTLQYTYIDGTPFAPFIPSWKGGLTPDTNYPCVVRMNDLTGAVVWSPQPCAMQIDAACEMDASWICKDGWLPVQEAAMCIKAFYTKRRKFSDARSHCQKMGGDLAKNVQLKKYRKMVMDGIKFRAHFWIGVEDLDRDGVAKFVDGSVVTGYKPFKRGRGLNSARNHLCASLKQGKWYGKRCSKKQFYICEKSE